MIHLVLASWVTSICLIFSRSKWSTSLDICQKTAVKSESFQLKTKQWNLTWSSPIITSSITLHSPSFTSSGRPNVDTISPPKNINSWLNFINNLWIDLYSFQVQHKWSSISLMKKIIKVYLPNTKANLSTPSKSACSIAMTPASANNCSG